MDFNEDIYNVLGIKKIDSKTQCWVVRCDNGRYFQHFLTHNLIAIAHLDELEYSNVKQIKKDEAFITLKEKYIDSGKKESAAILMARRQVTQANIFLNEIKKDDFVITMDSSSIAIGRVDAEPFIERSGLEIYNAYTESLEKMELYIRRKVEWQYKIEKEKIPAKLAKTLSSPQSVFEIHRHHDVFHMIYPFFVIDSNFHFSININTENEIKNYQIAKFLDFLNTFETLTQKYGDQSLNNQELNLILKASFMSPGEFWGILNFVKDRSKIVWAVIIYTFIFGNSSAGFDGIIDKEIKHRIFNEIMKRVEKSDSDKLQDLLPQLEYDIDNEIKKIKPLIKDLSLEKPSPIKI